MAKSILQTLATLAFFMTPTACLRAADPPADVQFTADIVYGKGAGEDLKLNLSRPKSDAKKLPCLVFVHGGGWTEGDRSAHNDATWRAAQAGYVSATVGYRLTPKYKFPAQVNDVKCAIRFLRAHADQYGLDPDRIGACGFSAGGHLVLMLGFTQKEDGLEGDGGWADQSSAVQAVVSFFGPTDLTAADIPKIDEPTLVNFLGGSLAEKRAEYVRASPVTYVNHGDAPTLILQGTNDPLVPYTQAYRLIDAMTRENVPGNADIILNAGHGWFADPVQAKRTVIEMYTFLADHLKPAKQQTTAPVVPKR